MGFGAGARAGVVDFFKINLLLFARSITLCNTTCW
jgi:hypothetical protein